MAFFSVTTAICGFMVISSCGDQIAMPVGNPSVESLETSDNMLLPNILNGKDMSPDSLSIYLDGNLLGEELFVEKTFSRVLFYFPKDLFGDSPDSIKSQPLPVVIVHGNDTILQSEITANRSLVDRTVTLPAGTFTMGSDSGNADERPPHEVSISNELEIMAYEFPIVLRKYLEGIPADAFGNTDGDNWLPISGISPTEAIELANQLSEFYGYQKAYSSDDSGGDKVWQWETEANGWRLPTEAEWEYIATYNSSKSPSDEELDLMAWGIENSGGAIKEVATKQPNGAGVYDMLGNVWEWCFDVYAPYSSVAKTDPYASPASDSLFTKRGGSVMSGLWVLRPTNRFVSESDGFGRTGFRVVRNTD